MNNPKSTIILILIMTSVFGCSPPGFAMEAKSKTPGSKLTPEQKLKEAPPAPAKLMDFAVSLGEISFNTNVKRSRGNRPYILTTITFTITNKGTAATPDLWQQTCWNMYYSSPRAKEFSEPEWVAFAMGGCKPIAPKTSDSTYRIDYAEIPLDAARIRIVVNSQQLIPDSDKSNNQDEKEIIMPELPKIEPKSAELPKTETKGGESKSTEPSKSSKKSR